MFSDTVQDLVEGSGVEGSSVKYPDKDKSDKEVETEKQSDVSKLPGKLDYNLITGSRIRLYNQVNNEF